jgi:multidrug efflux pump subunit AcrA (membrane-fusion protein)
MLAFTTAVRPATGQEVDSTAAALVAKLEADTVHRPVTADAVAQAKEALERAVRFHGAGDERHAKAAEGLAREWVETARDLARAADSEAAASDLRKKATDAQARLERVRALVEAGIARVGRLRAELDEAGRATRKERTAVETHAEDRVGTKKVDSKDKPSRPSTSGKP